MVERGSASLFVVLSVRTDFFAGETHNIGEVVFCRAGGRALDRSVASCMSSLKEERLRLSQIWENRGKESQREREREREPECRREISFGTFSLESARERDESRRERERERERRGGKRRKEGKKRDTHK